MPDSKLVVDPELVSQSGDALDVPAHTLEKLLNAFYDVTNSFTSPPWGRDDDTAVMFQKFYVPQARETLVGLEKLVKALRKLADAVREMGYDYGKNEEENAS